MKLIFSQVTAGGFQPLLLPSQTVFMEPLPDDETFLHNTTCNSKIITRPGLIKPMCSEETINNYFHFAGLPAPHRQS